MTQTPSTEIHLDHAASSPLRPEVAAAMTQAWQEHGNPASIHRAGQRARRLLETAREQVAAAINAEPAEIIFTSGATEADNQALRGLTQGSARLVTSPLEHLAVLDTARHLAAAGSNVTFLDGSSGAISFGQLRAAGLQQGDVVALMLVNNETGVLTDIRHLAMHVRKQGALLFCDAVQGFGTERIDVRALGVDALALSAHKIGGPRGVGVLYLRDGVQLDPLLRGGQRERGLRPGTSNLPAIVGMGVSAELAALEQPAERERLQQLLHYFEEQVSQLPGVRINAAGLQRSVKHSSVSFEDVDGEMLLMSLDSAGVQVSAGSACSAGSLEPSHVLLAMGLTPAEARATLRFSFGRSTTQAELQTAIQRLAGCLENCRRFAA
jgi:cysteine desulfurase